MIPPASSSPDPPGRELSLERPRPDARRVLWISLSVSAVLHLLGILVYAVVMARLTPMVAPADPTALPPRPQGTEVIRLVIVADEEAPSEEPEPPPEAEAPAPVPARPPGREPEPETTEAAGEEAPAPHAAELLRPPEEGDERIWRPTDPALLELSPTEVAELRAAGRLQDWADSVAAVREAERRALDWTHTDDEGRRWGVSPEGIHLGDVTLPIPSLGNTKHAEANEQQYRWAEIQRGAADAATRYRQEDRARVIRERMNREREEARADTTKGGGGG